MTQTNSCQTLENLSDNEVPITPHEYNNILNIQQEIFQMLASHGHTTDILEHLCQLAESLLPNSVASIMIKDENSGLLNVMCAPSIPEVGHQALANLKPGPGGGSCGNAIYRNEPQYVQDTLHDERWEDLRHIAHDFNLCSCWSMPIQNEKKQAIGTFALSSFEHRSPALFHKKLLETAAAIVTIVLKNQTNEKRLKLFATAAQNAAEGMMVTDKNNLIVEVNETFEKMYGYKESEILNKDPKFLSTHKHDKKFYDQIWQSLEKNHQWSGEITNKTNNGKELTQWVSISAIRNKRSEVENYLAIFSDLTQLKKAQMQIEHMAFHDSLTNLYNKIYLEKTMRTCKECTLILLNINNFSYINAAYGFEIGDKLLKESANILKDNFNAHSTYRINSDEFILLFEKDISITNTISDIQNYFYTNALKIDTISINISFTYGAVSGTGNLLRNGAIALKQAKANGKNSYHIFNEDRDSVSHSDKESFIASNNLIHKALDGDMIVPYFQGIYDNKKKKITKYESLVRIVIDNEVISPYKFLEPARLSGLLTEITKVMIEKSFKVMSKNNYTFSINITEDDLSRNYLIDFLNEKTALYNIKTERVILEILEGISSTGKESNLEQLKKIKHSGYRIAIDDFGAEYSNFERILDLDIDFIKIDAKYIKDIDVNLKSYEITKAITYFAKNANIECIAEFVHNESVQNIVDELGIDFSQGFYFSEPNRIPLQ